MTALWNAMHNELTMGIVAALLLRIVVSCACGMAIGFERSRRFKEAGVRTHCIVCLTAAVFMVLSKYAFIDLESGLLSGNGGGDPARIAAQVVSSIGFLGAGMIFKNGNTIRGLTTAAGIWATAAVGMAIGAGMYWVGIFTTLLIIVIQLIMHRFAVGNDAYSNGVLEVILEDNEGCREWLMDRMKQWGVQTGDVSVKRGRDGTVIYRAGLRISARFDPQEIMTALGENDGVISMSFQGD